MKVHGCLTRTVEIVTWKATASFQKLNREIKKRYPDVMMVAEESTAWPLVTAPPENDGLGFNYKWNMGWMNDTLRYMGMDPYFP